MAADERALADAVRAEATGLEISLAAKNLELERLGGRACKIGTSRIMCG